MKYPIGIQNFEKIRRDGYLYIDKTELVYKLVNGGSYYFLSRPRRFGKSLLISTMEAYFQGKKELFEGLAMERMEKDWTARPVLHIDLNARQYENADSLRLELNKHLEVWEQTYHSPYGDRAPEERFYHIIRLAHEQTGHRVAILVDEYDKPLLQAIWNKPLQEEFRNMLKPFYGVLKTLDGHIRFAMLTGVTKFGKISVFSDLNNLNDISMDNRYVSLCGITESEIHRYMEEGLHELAEAQGMDCDAACRKLREMYDGYRFTPESEGIYNPFSLLNTFSKRKFGSYWFETGTPTYLVELLKQSNFDLEHLTGSEVPESVLNNIYGEDKPIPVIYQSGYLTIRDYDKEFGLYTLDFPNKEVEEGFMEFLLPWYTSLDGTESQAIIKKLVRDIRSGDVDAFMTRLQSFMADTPYELIRDRELHYQNVLFIVFKLLGFYVRAEYHTSRGSIDTVLQTDRFVYVMEFKLEGSAEEALRQIEDRQYAAPFAADSRETILVGVNFSAQARNIDRWIVRR